MTASFAFFAGVWALFCIGAGVLVTDTLLHGSTDRAAEPSAASTVWTRD